jgi:hypothetical protein
MIYRFYVTEWQPNGTNDLIIVDQDSQIVEVIPEALFGVPTFFNRHDLLVCDSDQVLRAPWDQGFIDSILCGEISEFAPVEEISPYKALSHIAQSPVNNGSEAASILKKYIAMTA